MKKFIILPVALFVCACTSLSHEPSWQPAPSNEEGVDMYYWDDAITDQDNKNFKSTRVLAHGSSYGASLVFEITFNCETPEPSMRLNQINAYSEEYAKGLLVGKLMDKPETRWENISSTSDMRPFLHTYKQICGK